MSGILDPLADAHRLAENPLMHASIPEMRAALKVVIEELAERDRSFDLRWKADMRAIKRWQAEKPAERELVWPDHADLCVWLMGRLDSLEAGVRYVIESRTDNILMQGHLNALEGMLGRVRVERRSRPDRRRGIAALPAGSAIRDRAAGDRRTTEATPA